MKRYGCNIMVEPKKSREQSRFWILFLLRYYIQIQKHILVELVLKSCHLFTAIKIQETHSFSSIWRNKAPFFFKGLLCWALTKKKRFMNPILILESSKIMERQLLISTIVKRRDSFTSISNLVERRRCRERWCNSRGNLYLFLIKPSINSATFIFGVNLPLCSYPHWIVQQPSISIT